MKSKSLRTRNNFGGTLMGLVIGLLLGLGAALAVAVYVTKVPVPFVDRGVSRKPGQDAIEAERNKGWNPNAPLNGKSVTGVPESATGAETAGAIVVPPADGQPLPAAPVKPDTAGSKASADPLGDLVQSKLGAAPAPAANATASPAASPATADPFTYFVQVGAFRTPQDAETQKAKLGMLGIEAAITEREQNGRTVYRVRVGPFSQKALADQTREQLEVSGVEAALVRIQR